MSSDLEDRLAAWTLAERRGDAGTLTDLLHPDFVGVGPFGFLLTRQQWAQRFSDGLHYTAFDVTPDQPIRHAGDTAVIIATQNQAGTHQGRPIDGAFRITLVFIDDPVWRLFGAHLSLRNPPGPGS